MLNDNQIQALRQLSSKLTKERIDWLCIGGLAAIAWGANRKLADIDIQVSKKDIKKVQKIFQHQTTTSLRHYVTEKWDIRQIIIKLEGVSIDICQAEDFYVVRNKARHRLPNYLSQAAFRKVHEITVPVLPKNELIRYKQITARKVDILDLEYLQENSHHTATSSRK